MPRGRFQIVVLALALLFANVWCVAQCAVAPAQSHLPPCHRHHQSVKACASSVVVEAVNEVSHSPLATVAVLAGKLQTAAVSRVEETSPHPISPPPPLISSPLRS